MLVRRVRGTLFFGNRYCACVGMGDKGSGNALLEALSLPVDNVRNFCIIAHIDHGKSTLSDRIMEFNGYENKEEETQVLDSLEVEKDRGITVKAQTATMLYKSKVLGKSFVLNLVDTPGHVDFSYEVNRSVMSCDGGILLVDATQGIQAQTLANYRLAQQANLKIIPAITKMDMSSASPDVVKEQMFNSLDIDPDDVLETSGKTGQGVEELLEKIVEIVKPPETNANASFMAHLLDSRYDVHRGVVGLFKIRSGTVRIGDKISAFHGEKSYEVTEVGVYTPAMLPVEFLQGGQVGYITAAIRDVKEVVTGDTFYSTNTIMDGFEPLEKFSQSHSHVFAALYPSDAADFDMLRNAVEKLLINDASVRSEIENSQALGMGYRCGFNGLLHMEVFCERLRSEFNVDVIITAPTVPYKIHFNDGSVKLIANPKDFPDPCDMQYIEEPVVDGSIVCPESCLGKIHELCRIHRGIPGEVELLSESQIVVKVRLPLSEVVTSFYNKLKSLTSGHGTVDFKDAGFEISDLVKVDILINRKPVDALSIICNRARSAKSGKAIAAKLRKLLRRQNFEVIIQAAVGSKVLAKERIPPFRKDVLTKSGKTVGGGDNTRKQKLLEKQKKGKKRAKSVGNVEISQEAFMSVLTLNDE